jgi:hypothetical protein
MRQLDFQQGEEVKQMAQRYKELDGTYENFGGGGGGGGRRRRIETADGAAVREQVSRDKKRQQEKQRQKKATTTRSEPRESTAGESDSERLAPATSGSCHRGSRIRVTAIRGRGSVRLSVAEP